MLRGSGGTFESRKLVLVLALLAVGLNEFLLLYFVIYDA